MLTARMDTRGRIVFDQARDLFVLYADREGTHRDPKQLALSEHRDAERDIDKAH
jgi:hypothetical protein